MKISRTLLRGAAVLAIGAALVAGTISVPVASAAPDLRPQDNENGDVGIADVPIIGDLVSSFEGQEPEDIAVGAIQLTAGAAEVVVPMVIRLFK
jgi:hypothetical protein